MTVDLAVDGRVLDDRHPGVRRFWVPILAAWAERGGRGLLIRKSGGAVDEILARAGFESLEVESDPRSPFSLRHMRQVIETSGAAVTLSPLYFTLSGAARDLATVFDLTGRTHPRSLVARILWEATIRRVTRRASTVICATHSAAASVETAFPSLRGRTAVVPAIAPPVPRADDRVLEKLSLYSPYVLAVGSHRPHKRLGELARVWAQARPRVSLVVAGEGTEALTAQPAVRGLGFVKESEIGSLLARAGALVSASVAEGFGLPVLEAMVAGVPVICTQQSALAEIAGDAAAWLEVEDLPGLVHEALAIAQDPGRASRRIEEGRRRAAQFNADRALAAFERLVTVSSAPRTARNSRP